MHFLDRGLSHGAMSVVVPVSAVTGVGLSAVCGVLLGDRPTAVAWLGIVLSVPALGWSAAAVRTTEQESPTGCRPVPASRSSTSPSPRPVPPADCGRWNAGRVAAVLVLLPAAARHPRRLRLPPVRTVQAVLVGAGAALGLLLHLLAAQRQLPAVAVVLASLYPALPVILGLTLLHERLNRKQVVGLAGAGVATVLLSLG
jgi:drug/metabolite transporter (DMT)-like permease